MKLFTISFFLFLSINCLAQSSSSTSSRAATIEILSLQPSFKAGNVTLEWPVAHMDNGATWEIQGSVDGKSFKTIGLVWGAVNEATDNCIFKQTLKKLSGKFTHYRVVKESPITGEEIAKL